MMAERTLHRDHDMRPEADDALALLERGEPATTAPDDVEDGDMAAEDSGAGSFLDRFLPPLEPRRRRG